MIITNIKTIVNKNFNIFKKIFLFYLYSSFDIKDYFYYNNNITIFMEQKAMIIIGSDHGGWELKNYIKLYLLDNGYQLVDVGAETLDPEDDFSYYGKLLVNKMQQDLENNKGIFICGSGVGACIVCNRHKGIYAANCTNVDQVKLARNHNNLNVLNLGGRFVSQQDAIDMVKAFLDTEFFGGKYLRRCQDLDS